LQFAVVALIALVGFASAAIDTKDVEATIIDGSEKVAEYLTQTGYDYKFKTSNNIEKSEIADLAKDTVTGEYSYISPEGTPVKVTYTAGAGIGYYPKGDHIHPEILAAIELNLKNPPEPSTK